MSSSEQFEEEVKVMLSGYLGSNQDAVNYLALKIRKLHEVYFKKEISDNE